MMMRLSYNITGVKVSAVVETPAMREKPVKREPGGGQSPTL